MVDGIVERTEVTLIIVKRIFDITKMLGDLTAIRNEQQPILTLSCAVEQGEAFIPMEKSLKTQQQNPGEPFHKGRNFR